MLGFFSADCSCAVHHLTCPWADGISHAGMAGHDRSCQWCWSPAGEINSWLVGAWELTQHSTMLHTEDHSMLRRARLPKNDSPRGSSKLLLARRSWPMRLNPMCRALNVHACLHPHGACPFARPVLQ